MATEGEANVEKEIASSGEDSAEETAEESIEDVFRQLVESLLTGSPFPYGDTAHQHGSENGQLDEKGVDAVTLLGNVRRLVQHGGLPLAGLEQSGGARLAAIANMLLFYLPVLTDKALSPLATHVQAETTRWLAELFQLENVAGYYHHDSREGAVRATRLALHNRFVNYGKEGYGAFKRLPVIYVSATGSSLGQYVCLQIGLPMSCCSVVPHNTMFGSSHTMDVAAFERLMKEDLENGRLPLVLIASAGTPVVGHVDNLTRLQQLCHQNNVWMHVRGHGIALRLLESLPDNSLEAVSQCQSVTVSPGTWFGLPGASLCTFYKTADPSMAIASELRAAPYSVSLQPLSLWLSMQYLGRRHLATTVHHAIRLAESLSKQLNAIDEMKCVDVPLHCNHVIIFKYAGVSSSAVATGTASATLSEEGAEENCQGAANHLSGSALDVVNGMLLRSVHRCVPHMPLSLLRSQQHNECLRFSPLETAAVYGTSFEDIDTFIARLKKTIGLINRTLEHRPLFLEAVASRDCLQLLSQSDTSTGLGTLRYIPKYIGMKSTVYSPEEMAELNRVNAELTKRISESYQFVREVSTTEGHLFADIGWLTEDIEMEAFVDEIAQMGSSLEDSTRYLESMSEVIRRSIEVAQRDLQEAAQKRLEEEGVLRQVPVVGSVLNWFMPVEASPAKTLGRSLNLESGTLESTEKTYKYHMQVAGVNNEPEVEAETEAQ